jgi:hypothetical protein
VEQGIEPGMAYPIASGFSETRSKRSTSSRTIDREMFSIETMEKRLRKLFFVDYPEQTGDTPPTLGQWLDELARAQRRIGTPGMSFWREGPRAIFLRFKFCSRRPARSRSCRQGGPRDLDPALQSGAARRRAAGNRDRDAVRADPRPDVPRGMEGAVDGGGSMKAFIDKMRTSGLLKMRKPDQAQGRARQMTQMMGGQAPGARRPRQQPERRDHDRRNRRREALRPHRPHARRRD